MSEQVQANAQSTTNAEANGATDTSAAGGASATTTATTQQQSEVKTDAGATKVEAKVVPEKYKLKLPEGHGISQSRLDSLQAAYKQAGYSNEEAQKWVDAEIKSRQSVVDEQKAQLESVQAKWLADSKVDSEIGGDKYNEAVHLASQMIDKFASKEFKANLEATKFGNHPELVRMLYRIGKSFASDKFVDSSQKASPNKPIEEIFYPNMIKKE